MKTKDERLVELEETNQALRDMLREVAVLILSQVDPDAAGALSRYEDVRNAAMASNDKIHGPYCREAEWKHPANKPTGQLVYCGEKSGHAGPCHYSRAID